MGKSAKEVHQKIGQELAGVADVIILIKNSVTPWIEQGIYTTPSRFAGHPSLAGGDALQLTKENLRSSPPLQGGVPPLGGEVVGVSRPDIVWFDTAQEAHAALPKILKPGDVILFQNDWGDQYL
jgi:hypothetical protein